jgi:hypothetical protein
MPDQKQCFVISPIGDPDGDIRAEADWVLYQMIKPVLEPEFKVTRADAFPKIHVITNEVINSIRKADLVVADMAGHNANVFYELAVAHAYHRPVIPLIRDGDRIPFDTAPMGTIIYSRARHEKWEAAKAELKIAAQEALKPGYTVSNPITMAIGHEAASQSGDSLAKLVASQGEAIARLEYEVKLGWRSPNARLSLDSPMWYMHAKGIVGEEEEKIGRKLTSVELYMLLGPSVAQEFIRNEMAANADYHLYGVKARS